MKTEKNIFGKMAKMATKTQVVLKVRQEVTQKHFISCW